MSKIYVAVQRSGQNDNELTHWKYIKRVRGKNGKWRYYYDYNIKQFKDDLGVDELETYNDTKKRYEKALQNKREADSKLREFELASRGRNKGYDYETSHTLYRSSIYWDETTHQRGQEFMSARSELMRTPIGKLTPIKEGLDNAKNWLKKKLGIH